MNKLCSSITYAELERKLGFSNGSITKWKKSSPSVDKIIKVSRYFNVTTDYLLGLSDDPTPKAKADPVDPAIASQSNTFNGDILKSAVLSPNP